MSARDLHVATAGFLHPRIRALLAQAGWRVRVGWPAPGGHVGVWGRSPLAWRGEALARRAGAQLVRVEDAFLRSLHPARAGAEPPLGLLVDETGGVHVDADRPSSLESLLATHPLDDHVLLTRARDGIARMRRGHLGKYAAFDPDLPAPAPGYVLFADQAQGDASLAGAGRPEFLEMLAEARDAHPGARVVVKAHPESAGGRPGHLTAADGVEVVAGPVSPWSLMEGAVAVWTWSSGLGFESLLAGHRPVVRGRPWYAGWGATEDAGGFARRGRRLTPVQMFAAAMILAPVWHDPFRDRPGSFEDALGAVEADARAWREDRAGWTAYGIRRWKRPHLRRMLGRHGRITFAPYASPGVAPARGRALVWGDRPAAPGVVRLEDGLLRSRGLGADLTVPLSLWLDDLGNPVDPSTPSQLEAHISASMRLDDGGLRRAARLRERIVALGLSKYNVGGGADVPDGALLVVGQVEDDASVRLGATGPVRGHRDLLAAARAAHPAATILWKPHPDVEAALRPGAVADWSAFADRRVDGADAAAILATPGLRVWTLTSTMGFEALLRGVPVTCLGAPWYAGWGLTEDLAPTPARRTARPSLDALVHAALIDAPRYHDPVTDRPCPVEVAVERLATGTAGLGLLARLQRRQRRG